MRRGRKLWEDHSGEIGWMGGQLQVKIGGSGKLLLQNQSLKLRFIPCGILNPGHSLGFGGLSLRTKWRGWDGHFQLGSDLLLSPNSPAKDVCPAVAVPGRLKTTEGKYAKERCSTFCSTGQNELSKGQPATQRGYQGGPLLE